MINSSIMYKNRLIKIAFVGCGRISKNHIKAIASFHKEVELVALCDSKIPLIKKAEDLYKKELIQNSSTLNVSIKKFSDYSELLLASKNNKLTIDLIVFATPSGMHSSQVISAARLGINVCTEKPMATRWKDGVDMVKTCEKEKVRLFVIKQNRLNSTMKLVKKQLDEGRFGRLSMITVNVFWHRPQSYYDQDRWRGTWEFDGGALMNQASHYVDLLHWLIGPVESISASIATISRNIEVEDSAALQLKWRNGALGTMAVTMITYPKNLEGSITILGEKGTVKIGGPAVNKIEHWEFSDKQSDDQLIEKASYETSSVYGFGHLAYYKNMIDVLKGIAEPISDGREGLNSLELIISAYRSARGRELINLPLED